MFFLAQSQTCHILIISVFCNGVIGLKVILVKRAWFVTRGAIVETFLTAKLRYRGDLTMLPQQSS